MKNNKANISLYCPILFSSIGGAQKYTATIAQYISDYYPGSKITLIANEDCGELPENPIRVLNSRYGLELSGRVKVDVVPDFGKGLLNRWKGQKELRAKSDGVDLFINCFHNVHYFRGKKNVHLIHFPARRRVEASPIFSKNGLLKLIGGELDRKYERCYDLFICNSRFTENWLEKYWGINEDRRVVIYPPVMPRAADSIELEGEKENLILLLSRFDRRKNLKEAVEYFVKNEKDFEGWRLLVTGGLSKDDKPYFDEISVASAGHRVSVQANQPKEELVKIYRRASIFWHAMGYAVDEEKNPLDLEHFGITTVEAMAAGAIPVVIDRGGQKEIVDQGVNGFRWRTLDELGSFTKVLISDQKERRAFSKAAIEKSNRYCLQAFYESMDNLFITRNLLDKRWHR